MSNRCPDSLLRRGADGSNRLAALPLHPRTPRQTNACLRASAHSWDTLKTEIVTISHPAWKGVEHGTVSIESWADYTIQLLKIFWEDEMRSILREVLGSRSACEWTLESLWTFAKVRRGRPLSPRLCTDVSLHTFCRRKSRSSRLTRSSSRSSSSRSAVATARLPSRLRRSVARHPRCPDGLAWIKRRLDRRREWTSWREEEWCALGCVEK